MMLLHPLPMSTAVPDTESVTGALEQGVSWWFVPCSVFCGTGSPCLPVSGQPPMSTWSLAVLLGPPLRQAAQPVNGVAAPHPQLLSLLRPVILLTPLRLPLLSLDRGWQPADPTSAQVLPLALRGSRAACVFCSRVVCFVQAGCACQAGTVFLV